MRGDVFAEGFWAAWMSRSSIACVMTVKSSGVIAIKDVSICQNLPSRSSTRAWNFVSHPPRVLNVLAM